MPGILLLVYTALPGTPLIPSSVTPVDACRAERCGRGRGAQGGEYAWVRASGTPLVLNSVTRVIPLRAELFRSPSNERMNDRIAKGETLGNSP